MLNDSLTNPGTALKHNGGAMATASFTKEGVPPSIVSDSSPLPFLDKTFNATPDNKAMKGEPKYIATQEIIAEAKADLKNSVIKRTSMASSLVSRS